MKSSACGRMIAIVLPGEDIDDLDLDPEPLWATVVRLLDQAIGVAQAAHAQAVALRTGRLTPGGDA